MKKVLMSLLCMVLCVAANAVTKDNAVEMVEFEQRAYDSNSSVSLKNNTTEDVHNVTFQITYLDMKGRELDYKEYSEAIEIEPGKTKKLDIPAYERGRLYEYYKNREPYMDHPTFKVKFELKDYNTEGFQSEEDEMMAEYDKLLDRDDHGLPKSSFSGYGVLLPIVLGIIVFGAYIGCYFLVMSMARNRNRDVAVWLIVAIIGSPLLAIVILLLAGDDENSYR